MDIAPYRRAYFALCKSLGMSDDMRHAFNNALTRKPSTTSWTVTDWRDAVADLQRRAGQNVKPGRPRLRGRASDPERAQRVERAAPITAPQLEFISALASQIHWTTSAAAFIRARLLHPFRRDAWDGQFETLTRLEAANVITALRNWTGRNVAQPPPAVSSPEARR